MKKEFHRDDSQWSANKSNFVCNFFVHGFSSIYVVSAMNCSCEKQFTVCNDVFLLLHLSI